MHEPVAQLLALDIQLPTGRCTIDGQILAELVDALWDGAKADGAAGGAVAAVFHDATWNHSR